MSHSKYASTPQTTNLARISRLILGPCTDILRDAFHKEVPPNELSKKVQTWIDGMKNKRSPLTKSQTSLIFPIPSNTYTGNYADIDISLLYTLLRNVTSLPPHKKGWSKDPDPTDRSSSANIERLRLIRNKYYGHALQPGIQDKEFQDEFDDIREIIKDLEASLGSSDYLRAVDSIKTMSMDPELEKEYIEKISFVEMIQDEVEKQKENLEHMKDRIDELMRKKDPKMEKMIETTLFILEEEKKKTFIKTSAFFKMKDKVTSKGILLIIGAPGDGKTCLALHLMMEFNKTPMKLPKISAIQGRICPNENYFIFVDNLFGEYLLEVSTKEEKCIISPEFNAIFCSNLKNRQNFIVLTIRNDIYNEIHETRPSLYRFLNQVEKVDLSNQEHCLSIEEMKEIMSKSIPDADYVKELFENEEIFEKIPRVGFPQWCKILKENPSQKDLGRFENVTEYLISQIQEYQSRKVMKMAVLICLFLEGGEMAKDDLRNSNRKRKLKQNAMEIAEVSENFFEFRKAIVSFIGSYIDEDREMYRISHSSVKQALFVCLSKYHFEQIIPCCDCTLLKFLTTNENKTEYEKAQIDTFQFELVFERLSDFIQYQDILMYEAISEMNVWEDASFFDAFQNYIQNLSILGFMDQNGWSLMVHFAKVGNLKWVRVFLERLKTTRMQQCYLSLNAACQANHEDIVDILLECGTPPDIITCFHAIQSDNKTIVKKLVDAGVDLSKMSETLHPGYAGYNGTVIMECSLWGKFDLMTVFLELYPELIEIDINFSVLLTVLAGSVDILKKIRHMGVDLGSIQRNGLTMLDISCMQGFTEVSKFLINEYPGLLRSQLDQNISTLHAAILAEKKDVFLHLLSLGLNIDDFTENGKTILHIACFLNKEQFCKILVSKYPKLLFAVDNNGESILHYAAWVGNVDLFQFLLEKGADMNCTSYDGKTVLHQCCLNGELNMCMYLVDKHPSLLDVRDHNNETILHSTAWGGNVDMFKFLVGKGLDINSTLSDGKTVLHQCCINGKLDMCRYIVNAYPHLLNFEDNNNENVLHSAAWGGNLDLLEFLLTKDFNIQDTRNDGKSALHLCCLNGETNMCKYLVSNFPNLLDVEDKNGENPLHSAAWGGNVELFEFLSEKHFDINSRSNCGKTVLHQCCLNGEIDMCKYLVISYPHLLRVSDAVGETVLHDAACGGNIDIIKLLIKNGLDINTTRNDGKTVLHLCCLIDNIEVCKYLVKRYTNLLDVLDKDNHSVLHDAVLSGDVTLFKLLVEKGSDINCRTNDGKTVLHHCCGKGNVDLCRYLVNHYPHLLNIVDEKNRTALYPTAFGGNFDLLQFLIEKGLDVNIARDDGKTILHVCCMIGEINMCKYLTNTCPHLLGVLDNNGENVLHDAALGGNVDLFKLLLEKVVDVATTRSDGKTVLHLSCVNSRTDMCKYLVKTYPRLKTVVDNKGENVLHAAAMGDNIEILRFLLEQGLDVNSKRNDGKTALHICCMVGKINMSRYLSTAYPHLMHIRDNNGENVLHDAAWGGNVDLIKFLIEQGLDINSTSDDGKTVMHQCCMNGKTEMCKYIVSTYPHLLNVMDNSSGSFLEDVPQGATLEICSICFSQVMEMNS